MLSSVYMSYTSETFSLFRLPSISVLNFHFNLLMQTESVGAVRCGWGGRGAGSAVGSGEISHGSVESVGVPPRPAARHGPARRKPRLSSLLASVTHCSDQISLIRTRHVSA